MKIPYRKKVKYKETLITLYSIGWLAYYSNKGNSTLRRWESKKVLPRPLLSLEGDSNRMYSAREILGYSHVIKSVSTGRGIKLDFNYLTQSFNNMRLRIISHVQSDPNLYNAELPQVEEVYRYFINKKEITPKKIKE